MATATRFCLPFWLLFSRFLFQCNHRNSSEESHLKAFTSAGRLSYETAVGLNIKNIQTAQKKKALFLLQETDICVVNRHSASPINRTTNPTDGGY